MNAPLFKFEALPNKHVNLLTIESHAIFSSRNKSSKNQISRQYRSILKECVNNLAQDPTNQYSQLQNMYNEIEIVWNLCDSLMIEAQKQIEPPTSAHATSPELEEIILAASQYDLIKLIALCCSYFDDRGWFVAHFVDLLHSTGLLKSHDIIESEKLRESFILDYASKLFQDDALWPMGVSYLDTCETLGLPYLEDLLSRVPLRYDEPEKAYKLISIARKRGLTSISKHICLVVSKNWLLRCPKLDAYLDNETNLLKPDVSINESTKKDMSVNLSNAMYWAIKSEDTTSTTFISDLYLIFYCKTGTFPDESIFDDLGRSMLVSERLAFISKYYEFKQIYNESNVLEAANLLISLLTSKIYPKFFVEILLKDVSNLLDDGHLLFDTGKTLELMRTIEEVTANEDEPEDFELQHKLVVNMAKAMINQPQLETTSY